MFHIVDVIRKTTICQIPEHLFRSERRQKSFSVPQPPWSSYQLLSTRCHRPAVHQSLSEGKKDTRQRALNANKAHPFAQLGLYIVLSVNVLVDILAHPGRLAQVRGQASKEADYSSSRGMYRPTSCKRMSRPGPRNEVFQLGLANTDKASICLAGNQSTPRRWTKR